MGDIPLVASEIFRQTDPFLKNCYFQSIFVRSASVPRPSETTKRCNCKCFATWGRWTQRRSF